MSEALKLCPFCGGEMEYPYLNHPDVAKHPTHLRCFAAMAIVHPENADAWNTRTDLPATDEQAFANEKVKVLLIDVGSSLVAAVSLLECGGKQAAFSDKMFEQMLTDYRRSVDRLRASLASMEPKA